MIGSVIAYDTDVNQTLSYKLLGSFSFSLLL